MWASCDTHARLDGKVAVVTGGSAGMGYDAARNLAKRGARVIIASRDERKANEAKRRIVAEAGRSDVVYRQLDLASLKSVRAFVSDTVLAERRLDMLVNNVGAVSLPDVRTDDGLHLMMQVNYFGTFLLTYLLIPLLKSSAPSRIINVSAATMYVGQLDFDHMNDIGRWSSINLLANSKLAISLFTAELDERLSHTGVAANSMDPFLVADTEILKGMPSLIQTIGSLALQVIGRPRLVAGNELAYLASEPALDGVSGQHFKFCVPYFNSWLTRDTHLRRVLWETSKRLVHITAAEDWEAVARPRW